MSFAPKQFIRSVDFLSTENAINTSTGCVNIYGGMSVSKDSYLTNMTVVGNSTINNLNITGALITSTGNSLVSSQWVNTGSNGIYFGTSANTLVGIGTTTPGFTLDISGGSRITGALTVGNLNVNSGATITNILNTTICTGTIISSNLTTSNIYVTSGNVTVPNGQFLANPNDTVSAPGFSWSGDSNVGMYRPSGDAIGLVTFGIERMRITSTGNVGIGTTSPSTTLDVSGTARITTSLTTGSVFSTNQTTTNIVGTNISGSNLQVSGTINSGDVTVGNINFTGSLYQNGSAYVGSQWTSTSGNTLTYTSGNVIVNSGFSSTFNSNTLGNIFTTGGNIGIGTTNPSERLTVSGNVSLLENTIRITSAFNTNFIQSDNDIGFTNRFNGTPKVIITTSGNIGVGISSPTNNIDVTGTGRITTSLTTGALYSTNQTTTNIVGTNISGSNLQVSGTINSGDVTVGNINFTGSLYQNGSAYLGSQWTTTSGNTLTYTSGNVSINSGFSSTFNSNTVGPIITTGGNVGIGTSNPDNRISIQGSGGTTGTISFNHSTNIVPYVGLGYNETLDGLALYLNQGDTKLNNIGIIISRASSGNVGIGTNTPGHKLDVSGTSRITTSLTTGSLFSTNQTTTNIVSTNLSSGTLVGTTISTSNIHGSLGTISNMVHTNLSTSTLNATTVSSSIVSATTITGGNLSLSGNLNVAGTLTTVNITSTNLVNTNVSAGVIVSSTLLSATGNSNTIGNIFTTGGNIGIGTTAPSAKLDIVGGSLRITGGSLLATHNSNTVGSLFTTGGNVGIATGSPSEKLHISVRNGEGSLQLKDHPLTTTMFGSYRLKWYSDYWDIGADRGPGIYAEGMRFSFNDATYMTIDRNGKVGIGTSSPSAKLDIVGGSLRITGGSLLATHNSNTVGSLFTTGGNVGIGVSSPGGKLDIVGTNRTSHFSLDTDEHTYIRGGKTNSNVLINDNGGNVGIGTSSPGYQLDVNGDISINGTIFSSRFRRNFDTRTLAPNNISVGTFSVGFGSYSNNNGSPWADIIGLNTYFDSSGQNVNALYLRKNTIGMRIYQGVFASASAFSDYRDVVLAQTNGNVGINNDSPSGILDIIGNTVDTYVNVRSSANNRIAGIKFLEFSDTYGAGIYYDGSNDRLYMGHYVNSTTSNFAFTLVTSGNVGIGTTAPGAKLDVNGELLVSNSAGWSDVKLKATSDAYAAAFIAAPNGTVSSSNPEWLIGHKANAKGPLSIWKYDGTNQDNYLTISTGGNVGIGTTAPAYTLDVNGSARFGSIYMSSSQIIYNNSTQHYTAPSGNWTRISEGAGNASIDLQGTRTVINGTNIGFTGNVGIGTTSPSYTLHVAGDIYATGDVISFSDSRLKTDVETITGALDKVSNMRGVYYTNLNTQTRETGVIAQEIMDVLPEVVGDKGEYLGVAYGNIVGVLIEAIKELKARVAELESSQ